MAPLLFGLCSANVDSRTNAGVPFGVKLRDIKFGREPNELGRVSGYPVENHRVGFLGRLPEKAVGLPSEYSEPCAGDRFFKASACSRWLLRALSLVPISTSVGTR